MDRQWLYISLHSYTLSTAHLCICSCKLDSCPYLVMTVRQWSVLKEISGHRLWVSFCNFYSDSILFKSPLMITLPFIWLIWLKEDRRCSLVILKRKVLHKFRLLLFLIADHVTIELPACLWSLCDFLWSLCDLIRTGRFQSFDSFPVFSWLLFLEAEKLQFLFFKQGPINILMSWQVILFSYFRNVWLLVDLKDQVLY